MVTIVPAILPKTFSELEETIFRLQGVAPLIQIDLVGSYNVLLDQEALPLWEELDFEIDIMLPDPAKEIQSCIAIGASRIIIHVSAPTAHDALLQLQQLRTGDIPTLAGIALVSTDTPEMLQQFENLYDFVQVMGIEHIGKQGEPFDERAISLVKALRTAHPDLFIQVDGAAATHVTELVAAGVNRLVVGSAIIRADDPKGVYKELYTKANAREKEVRNIEEKAEAIRETIIEMLVAAGSGHTAGPLGMADIFASFYFHILAHDPANPSWEDRDRLFLSNGHITPVRYAAMAHAGYFPVAECLTLRKFGSRLQGHPERTKLPGVETTSGPLGSGLSQAAGYAYGARMDGKKFRVFCAMSDGEHDAGNTWEGAMFAGANKLSNLTGVIDRNNIQINGMTEQVMPLEGLRAKYEAFNWHVIEVDGHNIKEFCDAIEQAKAIFEKPTVIIAHTIPGKGIKEIEFDYTWHGKPPSKEEAQKFLLELRTMKGKIKSEHQ